MKTMLALPMAMLLALSVPALAQIKPPSTGDKPPSTGVKGAPGPIVGAGLPVLLIGGGIYWIVRRQRKTKLGS